jgi:hypothetical protein
LICSSSGQNADAQRWRSQRRPATAISDWPRSSRATQTAATG